MAKLKRNIIQLVEDPKANEIKLQTYLTPHFISFEIVYEAMDLIDDKRNRWQIDGYGCKNLR